MKKIIQILLATSIIIFTGCSREVYEIPERNRADADELVRFLVKEGRNLDYSVKEAKKVHGVMIGKFDPFNNTFNECVADITPATSHEVSGDTLREIVREYMAKNPVSVERQNNNNEIMFLKNRITELERQIKIIKDDNDEFTL